MSKEYVNVDGWHAVVGRIEKSKKSKEIWKGMQFSLSKNAKAQATKMVAFHLAWQLNYARFSIVLPLINVEQRRGSASRGQVC